MTLHFSSPHHGVLNGARRMKTWETDLLDHLVFLVVRNTDSPPSEDEVRDELKRELGRFLSQKPLVRPPSLNHPPSLG